MSNIIGIVGALLLILGLMGSISASSGTMSPVSAIGAVGATVGGGILYLAKVIEDQGERTRQVITTGTLAVAKQVRAERRSGQSPRILDRDL